MQRRPFVEAIADGLEGCLVRNDTKPAWEKQSVFEVGVKMLEEYSEFMEAVFADDEEAIQREGFDLIASVAMVMAKHGFGNPEWMRGRAYDPRN